MNHPDNQAIRIECGPTRWPGNRHVAVVLNVAYETWGNQRVSAVGPMGNPLTTGVFDTNADSYGRYGATSGIERLLRKLDRAGAKADVFVSGALAEKNAAQIRAIVNSGHAIVGHGYTQDQILSALNVEEEERVIHQTTEALSAAGARPTGWISPRATPSPSTAKLLAKHGYRWQCDAIDSSLPYLEKFDDGHLLAIPFTVEFNDLSHAMRFGRTPQQFIDLFQDSLEATLADEEDVVILDVLVHTHCYGRPAAAWAFEAIARSCVARDDIWLTTRGEIADHLQAQCQEIFPSFQNKTEEPQ